MAIPIYCMPGMAASSRIFEHLKVPKEYEMHFLEWVEPNPKESLKQYAKRIAQQITLPSPILIGVSLGGILMQEIALLIPNYRDIILISSIKSEKELPYWMQWCKRLKLHHLLPLRRLASIQFWKNTKRYKKLYVKYIGLHTANYLAWSVQELLDWKAPNSLKKIIHIHGDRDPIFPIKNIKECIVLPKGTHIMIINRFRWLNEQLPKILMTNDLQ